MSNTELKKGTAYLIYKVEITCPYCKNHFDLMDRNDDDSAISQPIFNNNWDELKGDSVICDHCEEEFLIEELVY